MYIIIIGGGKVGFYLAKALLNEGHEILVIERDASRTEFINNELGSVCIRGDGSEVTTLTEVGTGRANMFISVTGDDALRGDLLCVHPEVSIVMGGEHVNFKERAWIEKLCDPLPRRKHALVIEEFLFLLFARAFDDPLLFVS